MANNDSGNSGTDSSETLFNVRVVRLAVFGLMEAAMWTLFNDLPKWFLYMTIVIGALVILALEFKHKSERFYKIAPWGLGGFYLVTFAYAAYATKAPVQ